MKEERDERRKVGGVEVCLYGEGEEWGRGGRGK